MKTFTINFEERNFGFVEVQANSLEEATKIAELEYHNGNVVWSGSSHFVLSTKT